MLSTLLQEGDGWRCWSSLIALSKLIGTSTAAGDVAALRLAELLGFHDLSSLWGFPSSGAPPFHAPHHQTHMLGGLSTPQNPDPNTSRLPSLPLILNLRFSAVG